MSNDSSTHCRLLPLNQIAALKLKEAGEAVSPQILPVLQLMSWGVRHGIRTTHRQTLHELERLQVLAPDEVFAFLTGNVPGGQPVFERQLLGLTPRAAAELLLDTLDMCLKADPGNSYPA